MLLDGNLVRVEPLVKTFDWYGGGWNFSPLGHRPGVAAGEIVPTYPMGLPVVMALTRSAFGDFGEHAAVPCSAQPWCSAASCSAAGSTPGSAAWWRRRCVATSPVQLFHVVQPMSDVPAAAWLVLALAAALGDRWPSAVVAGMCLGMAAATRPNLAPLALAVAACAAGWPRRSWRQPRVTRVALLGLGLVPVLGPLMGMNLSLYGSATSTGYGGLDQYFASANILPNVGDYLERIVRGELPALWLSAAAIAILVLRRRAGPADANGSAVGCARARSSPPPSAR